MKHKLLHVIRLVRSYAVKHKMLSVACALVLVVGGYLGTRALFGTSGETRYVVAKAEKGTLVVSVSGSGQVSASHQVDLKSKVSGDVVYVGVVAGQEVRAGTLIAQLDARDAQKAVRDAEVNLESAKLSLEKLKKPADKLSLLQSENALLRAKESKQTATENLQKAYEDGFNSVANAFLDLPTAMTGLQDILFSSSAGLGGAGQRNIDYYANAVENYDSKVNQYKADTSTLYDRARAVYDKNADQYKSTNRFSSTDTITALIGTTYETTKNIAEAIKSANNFIQFYKDKMTDNNSKPAALADTHLASLNTYTGKTNTHLSSLLVAKNAIQNNKDALLNADRAIAENTESLTKLKLGPDSLDTASAELAIKQRENSLLDAKEKLADYFIRAPFDGTVAKVSVKKSDFVSSGVIAATFITKQKIAELSLNEVDLSKIKVGNKVTLTFDAIEGLTIAATVVEIDTVGTVTQGVVTYSVKIAFDTQDDRVKSGMSVSANIITEIKQGVVMVPGSAVKSQGQMRYVEMFDQPIDDTSGAQGTISAKAPSSKSIEVGLSNDTSAEVISGLKEGDQVVVRTILPTAQATTQTAPSLFPTGGGRGFGGGGGGGRGGGGSGSGGGLH